LRFTDDEPVDDQTEILAGTGTMTYEGRNIDVTWEAVMKKEGGWKVKQWNWHSGTITVRH
jgi:hypothetical protein